MQIKNFDTKEIELIMDRIKTIQDLAENISNKLDSPEMTIKLEKIKKISNEGKVNIIKAGEYLHEANGDIDLALKMIKERENKEL